MTKQLPVSYLLLPKGYKDTKNVQNKFNLHFCSYQEVTIQLLTVIKEIQENQNLLKYIQHSIYCSDQAVTSQLSNVIKEINGHKYHQKYNQYTILQ